MKKKQVESSASEEEEVLAEDSEASEDEELSEEGPGASDDEEEEEDSQASSDEDNSEASDDEEDREQDLAASSTESDEDDDEEEVEAEPAPKSRAELIDEKIHSKYEQLRGTRLYVRFPKKLPLDVDEFNAKVKALHPLVEKALKPRQKHARFCLVQFKSQEDRDQAHEDLLTSIKNDAEYKGFHVSLPKTDSDEFVNELVTRKQTSVENRRTKRMMKRASKKALQGKRNFTSSVVITNLPKTASVAQVRQLFTEAVDIQIKPGKGKFRDASAATVTLPTTHDARNAIKQKLSLAGTELIMRFNTQTKRKTKPNAKNGTSTPAEKKNKQEDKKIPKKQKQQNKQQQQKPEIEKGEAPKAKKPVKNTAQQKPKENLKRKATPSGGETLKLKTPKKMKKLSA